MTKLEALEKLIDTMDKASCWRSNSAAVFGGDLSDCGICAPCLASRLKQTELVYAVALAQELLENAAHFAKRNPLYLDDDRVREALEAFKRPL